MRADPTRPTIVVTGRLLSLDALRGFDLLWILGGAHAVRAWHEAGAPDWVGVVEAQMHHAAWHGFTAWDLVFPLFLFLAGVSLPFSYAKRRAAGAGNGELVVHALRRGALLVLLGAIYNGLFTFAWDELRLASVLGRIGLAYVGAAVIAIALPRLRDQVVAAVVLVAASWGLLLLPPFEPGASPSLEFGKSFYDWFDRAFLPGRLHQEVHDPEGLLATLPAIVTALSGVWTGRYLASRRVHEPRTSSTLAVAGVVALAVGWLWSHVLPWNKNLWTPSFVAWCAGWSLVLLSVFHYAVDVARMRRTGTFFAVVGANSILLYLLERFVDWRGLADVAFARAEGRVHPALLACGGLALQWLLAAWLHRRRIFLRV